MNKDESSVKFKRYLSEVFDKEIADAPHVFFISPSNSCPYCEKYSSEKLSQYRKKVGVSVILVYEKKGLVPLPDSVLNHFMIDTSMLLKRLSLGTGTRLVFTSKGQVDSIKELTARNISIIDNYVITD